MSNIERTPTAPDDIGLAVVFRASQLSVGLTVYTDRAGGVCPGSPVLPGRIAHTGCPVDASDHRAGQVSGLVVRESSSRSRLT